MGLDMYLDKVRRIDGAKLEELDKLNSYYRWKEREEKYKYCSMKRWCGVDRKEVPDRLIRKYKDEYVSRYFADDINKKWAFKSVFQNVAYWRKANQIHNWFVNNVQNGVDDCKMHEVSKGQLKMLLADCEAVLRKRESAEDVLPTQSGFFFGDTEYDECYFEQVTETVSTLKQILKETDFDNWIVFYVSSW